VRALVGKLTDLQAQQTLNAVLQAMRGTTDAGALKSLTEAVQALPGKLTHAQTQQALDAVLRQMQRTADEDALRRLAQAVQALAGKLIDSSQAQQALEAVMQAMQRTTDATALQRLAQAVQAVAGKLTEAQAQQALDAVLQAMRGTTDADTHLGLAQAAQAVAGKLTDAQAPQVLATSHLQSAFGWSATSEESAAWAEAIVTLLRRSGESNFVSAIVELLKYPIAAGPATDVLLNGLSLAASTAPGAEAGLPANLRWLADNYPAIDLRGAPACPTPLWAGPGCPSEP
jgi:hypothetical protein